MSPTKRGRYFCWRTWVTSNTGEASTNEASTSTSSYRTLDEIKESGKIVIGVFSDKAPFGYIDENGDYQGYDVYFAERLAEDLGVEVEYVSTDPASRVEYVATGKVDLILANFTVTEERAQQVDFALPYMKVTLGVVSPDSGLITSVDQLAGKTLIVVKGTTAETYFEKNYPDVTLQKYDEYAPMPTTPCSTAAATPSPRITPKCSPGRCPTPASPWEWMHWAMPIPSPPRFRRATPPFSTGSTARSKRWEKRTSSMLTTRPLWLPYTVRPPIPIRWSWKAEKSNNPFSS